MDLQIKKRESLERLDEMVKGASNLTSLNVHHIAKIIDWYDIKVKKLMESSLFPVKVYEDILAEEKKNKSYYVKIDDFRKFLEGLKD